MNKQQNDKEHATWTDWGLKISKQPYFSVDTIIEHLIKHLKECKEENDDKSWFYSTINLLSLVFRSLGYRTDVFASDIDYAVCNKMFERHEKKRIRDLSEKKMNAWKEVVIAHEILKDSTPEEFKRKIEQIIEDYKKAVKNEALPIEAEPEIPSIILDGDQPAIDTHGLTAWPKCYANFQKLSDICPSTCDDETARFCIEETRKFDAWLAEKRNGMKEER